MNRHALLLSLSCLLAVPALAQELKTPAPSPGAKVTQTVGLTDITIDYSSPAVKGRKIWGELVPFDKVWRAGANRATTITFSQPVVIADKEFPAGTYGFFVLPTTKDWTLILNKVADQWGAYEYKQETDVLRVPVKTQAIPMRERLLYTVSNFTNDAASIDLEWEKVRVSLPVKLKTTDQVAAAMKAFAEDAWVPLYRAARWSNDNKDYATGLGFVEKSILVQATWNNTWLKAQLLAGAGKFKDAVAAAEKSMELGAKDPADFPAEAVKKAMAEWKKKS